MMMLCWETLYPGYCSFSSHLSGPYFHIFSSFFICWFSIHGQFILTRIASQSLLYQWLARQSDLLKLLLARQTEVHPTMLWVLRSHRLALDWFVYTTCTPLFEVGCICLESQRKRILRTLLCLSRCLVWAIALHPANTGEFHHSLPNFLH